MGFDDAHSFFDFNYSMISINISQQSFFLHSAAAYTPCVTSERLELDLLHHSLVTSETAASIPLFRLDASRWVMRDSQKTSVVDHQSLAPLLTFDWRNLIVFFFLSFLSPLQIICCSVEWTGEIYDRAWSRDTTCQFAWNQFSSVQWTQTLRVRFQWNFLLATTFFL